MNDCRQIISGGDIDVGPARHLLERLAEINQTSRVEDGADYRSRTGRD